MRCIRNGIFHKEIFCIWIVSERMEWIHFHGSYSGNYRADIREDSEQIIEVDNGLGDEIYESSCSRGYCCCTIFA